MSVVLQFLRFLAGKLTHLCPLQQCRHPIPILAVEGYAKHRLRGGTRPSAGFRLEDTAKNGGFAGFEDCAHGAESSIPPGPRKPCAFGKVIMSQLSKMGFPTAQIHIFAAAQTYSVSSQLPESFNKISRSSRIGIGP